MRSHYYKDDFPWIGLTIVFAQIAAFIIFVLGASVLTYGILEELPFSMIWQTTLEFLVVSFGLFIAAEFLQLLLKIEVNTRKSESEMMKLIRAAEKKLGRRIHSR